jgi:hypothetical protein
MLFTEYETPTVEFEPITALNPGDDDDFEDDDADTDAGWDEIEDEDFEDLQDDKDAERAAELDDIILDDDDEDEDDFPDDDF